ncbi:MAG: hypothetical protein DRO18_04425 [Thermoprotei archaeon]|nr:MAG: hypothetical protein DRO18_04425 [Thermoprotei archaeon]
MRLSLDRASLIQVLVIVMVGFTISFFVDPRVRVLPLMTSIAAALFKLVLRGRRKAIGGYEVNEDLIYLVTHMYAVSTGRPPNRRLFMLDTWAGGYGGYDSILRRIAILAVDWGYGFAKAIRIVVSELRNKIFRDFLLRLGELLNIGEEPTRFLDIERRALLTEYQAHYTRLLEASKLLLGVYTSGVSSAIFIMITFLIFIFLFSIPPSMVIMVYIAILISLSILAYILYKVLPRDRVTHKFKVKIPEKIRYRSLLIFSLASSVAVGFVALNMFKDPYLAISIAAVPLVAPGLYAKKVEKKIREIESFFSIFVRSFGLTYSMIPHTPTALASTLRSDYGPLTKYLRRSLARLNAGIDPKVAWYYFIGETWSEVVRRNVNILYDSINVGGDLAKVGTVLSETTFRLLDIRKQRVQVAKAFESTIYIVHTLFSAIMSFVLSLLLVFNNIIMKLQSVNEELASVLPFKPMMLDVAVSFTPIFIIALSVLNAFVIKVAQGGMYETLWVPLAILLAAGGIVMYLVSLMSTSLFSSITGLAGLMEVVPG